MARSTGRYARARQRDDVDYSQPSVDAAAHVQGYIHGGNNEGLQVHDLSYGTIPDVQVVQPAQGASVSASSFNLIKNIVGAGVLALPGGVAAFSQARGAAAVAAGLTAVMGLLSCYCFSLIGRVCAATGAKGSYGDAWGRSVGYKTAWVAAASSVAKTVFACLEYSIIIGDTFSDVMVSFGAPEALARRCNILSLVSAIVLLPMCLTKDLGPLAYTSLLGILGNLYTAAVMALRYWDGSYAPGGRFVGYIPEEARPAFGGTAALNPLALILVSMLSTAFIAHYNAPKYYRELANPSVFRYNLVAGSSHLAAVALYISMTAFPFLTFGGASMSFILNNYSTSDGLATLCRLAVGASVVFAYPLVFVTAREGTLSALGMADVGWTSTLGTLLLLTAFTGFGIAVRDLGYVVSLGGALLGSALIYIFPAVMWICLCRRRWGTAGRVPEEEPEEAEAVAAAAEDALRLMSDSEASLKPLGWQRAEYHLAFGIAGLGVVLGVLGAVVSTMNTFFGLSLSR